MILILMSQGDLPCHLAVLLYESSNSRIDECFLTHVNSLDCTVYRLYLQHFVLGVAIFYDIFFFSSYFVFSCIAVLPHSPGIVNYHLLLRR